jgi:AraC family transcriptional regulator of adaptative response / DNA-3-methyladenine glycosylase II
MAGRLAAVAGRSIDALDDEATNVVFPSPAELAESELAGLGFTDRRIATVRAVSGAVADGTLDLYRYVELDELEAQYCGLPGVGPWTAQLAAMRLHRHRDAFPAGDLGIRKGVALLIGSNEVPTARAVTELAQRWRPHRSLAAQLLWAIADEGVLP